MKLSDTVQYINQALNYPALNYVDISLFFDMAIAELNTTLHTSIPAISVMTKDFKRKVSKYEPNKVILTTDPEVSDFVIPSDPVSPTYSEYPFYYDSHSRKFKIYDTHKEEYLSYETIKGLYTRSGKLRIYQSINYGTNAAWTEVPVLVEDEADLGDYLPDDWVLLWLIPYVCFKYTVRDGGTAQSFAEELTQGFQQLQETYNVPDKVLLSKYADKPAYTELVEENLPNLNIIVPTRAIYDSMKHSRNINAVFGSFYDRGGF